MACKILLTTINMSSHGGVANQVATLAVQLQRRQINSYVLVYAPISEGNPYAKLLANEKVKLLAINESTFTKIQSLFRVVHYLIIPLICLDALLRTRSLRSSWRGSWGFLRRFSYLALELIYRTRLAYAAYILRIQLVHVHNCDGWKVIRWAKKLGLKVIYTDRSTLLPVTQKWYAGLQQTIAEADIVTCVSKASARSLQVMLPDGSSPMIIHNAVEVSDWPFSAVRFSWQFPFTIGYLGRLSPEKDVETLVRSVSTLLERVPDIRLLIYGDGNQRGLLEQEISQRNLKSNILLCGAFKRQHLSQVMREIDLVALSSLSEGLPGSLIEAMAYGKPVVATAVGGSPEVVVDGVTGLLVPPKSPRLLADAIMNIYDDQELYQRMAKAAYQHYLSNFTPDQIVPQYIDVYRQLSK